MVKSKYFPSNSSSNTIPSCEPFRHAHSSYCDTRSDVFKLNLLVVVSNSAFVLCLWNGIGCPEQGNPITFVTDTYVKGISHPLTTKTEWVTFTFLAKSAQSSRCSLVTFNSSRQSNPSEINSFQNWGLPLKWPIRWLFNFGLHLVWTTIWDWGILVKRLIEHN